MTVPVLGINIDTSTAVDGVRNLDALVPAAQRVERAVDKMSANVAQDMRAIEGSTQAASKGFASLGSGQISNVAFQLQDFAVQVGAGTSASTALAMQLPQLLGGFGALGAVLGAVVAVGVPLASAFLGVGDGAKDLDDRLNDLEKSLKSVDDAMALASTDALIERYGSATQAVRDLQAAMADSAAAQARAQSNALVQGQWGNFADTTAVAIPDFGPVSDDVRAQMEAAFEGATVGVDRLRQALQGISQEQATTIQGLMVAARDQNLTYEQQADAIARVRAALGEVRDEFGNIIPEAQALRDETISVEDALRQAAAQTGALESGMSGATSAIDAAGAAASRVADEIARAVGNLNSLMAGAQTALREAQIRSQFRGDPVGTAGAIANARSDISGLDPILRDALQPQKDAYVTAEKERVRLEQELADWNKAQATAARKSGGGGRGGKSDAEKEADKAKREMEREAEARKKVEEGLAREIELVGAGEVTRRIYNETFRAGVDLYSEAGQKIAWNVIEAERLNAEWERATEVNKMVAESFSEMFTNAITGADSLKDSIGQLLSQLGQMAINNAFMSLMQNSGFGASGIGQGIASLLGIGSFDGGGYTGSGPRSGGLDGKGGFLALMHPQETVTDHTRGQATPGGPSKLEISLSKDLEARILRQAAGQAVQVAQRVAPAAVRDYNLRRG